MAGPKRGSRVQRAKDFFKKVAPNLKRPSDGVSGNNGKAAKKQALQQG